MVQETLFTLLYGMYSDFFFTLFYLILLKEIPVTIHKWFYNPLVGLDLQFEKH